VANLCRGGKPVSRWQSCVEVANLCRGGKPVSRWQTFVGVANLCLGGKPVSMWQTCVEVAKFAEVANLCRGSSIGCGSQVNFMRKAINTPAVVTAGKINYTNVYWCLLFALSTSHQLTLTAEHRDAENNLFLLQKNINAARLLGIQVRISQGAKMSVS